jgi:hypothetical protein
VTIVAVLPEPVLQDLNLLTQQDALFLLQSEQFFFGCHISTVSALLSFDKLSRTPE